MKSKERILKALNGEKADMNPTAIHGWGLYKFAMAGILKDYNEEHKGWSIAGEELANIEISFYEKFKPDWMHLSEGPCFDDIKDRINNPEYSELLDEVRELESKRAIDEFMDVIYPSVAEFKAGPKFKHVEILSKKYGDEVFIALHTAAPICDIADARGVLEFEPTMMAMIEKTDMFLYLAESMYQKQLNFVKALKDSGAHSYIQSEAYVSSDLISPKLYEKTLFGIQREFFREVERIGLIPMCYFTGDINPLLCYIKNIGIKGLLIEESKKNMILNPGAILEALDNSMAVFGNIDGVNLMLKGTREQIKQEVISQIKNADSNYYIVNTGSPIAFGTPEENIAAYIEAAREYRREK